MSSKEVKNSLKSAKDCMDKKEFGTALQHCKNALQNDRKNYMALILFGACLQETEQSADAPKAFKKAALISPELPLAWKGLSAFYEKQNRIEDRSELLNAYINLLKIENDFNKIEEWARKIGVLLSLLDNDTLVTTWKDLRELPDPKKQACLKVVFTVVGSMEGDAPESFLPMLEELLSVDWKGFGNEYCINIYKKYLKLLFKLKNLDVLLRRSRELYDKFPSVVAGPEWFCMAYLEAKFGTDSYESEIPEPSEMYMILLNLVPNSYLGFASKGVDELACQEFVAACDSLTCAVQLKPTYGIAWYLLTQGQSWLHRFAEAEHSARQALQHWKQTERNVESIMNCKYWLAKALCEQDVIVKCQESIRIADEFIFDSPNKVDFLPILIKASIKTDDQEKYEKYMALLSEEPRLSHEKLLLEAFRLKREGDIEKCKNLLLHAAEEAVDKYEVWLELGKLHFESGDVKSALRCILKSTKMNEWCPVNFRLLGHIYHQLGDLTKARRCYQKAFQLSFADFEAGIGLSDVYRMLGMEEENLKLLTVATQVQGARWAWLKLGLHYLSVNDPVQAVSSLRVAVRLNASDRNAWESLGDAYLALGSYSAALKSYQKVLELNPGLVYPVLQIAMSKHLQGLHEEAVLEFRQALAIQPDFLPALSSHAVSCLALMRLRLEGNLNGLAADSCQEAVSSLTTALKTKKDLICIWKSLGDACVLISKLPLKYCKLKIPSWLWTKSDDGSAEVTLQSSDVLQLSVRCFCHAIALSPGQANLWYDLAVCYHGLADNVSSSKDKSTAREAALCAVKKSIKLKDDSWASWNLLGILTVTSEVKNYPVAQHAFVKAIGLDGFNAVPWCNLGCLHLSLKDLQLANQCFTEAQRCDPDYVQCWIGQAMLAESTGHHEAIDLYRHSTQLNFHPEGALGYTSMVLSMLIDTQDKTHKDYIFTIKNMNALTIACDATTWYTDRFPHNPCAFNMLGLLLERLKLYRRSAEAFHSGLSTPQASELDQGLKDKIVLNYGRVLAQLGQTNDAIEVLKQIQSASFESQCVLALAYVRGRQLAEAYGTYQSALEWLAPDDEQKSHILVAMAGVVYIHQGHKDAKLLLMQACQLQPVSVAGLFACCSLGLLHSDLPLTELALKELARYRDDPQHLANIALLQAYTALIKGETVEARRALCWTAHRHPEDPTIWLHLGQVQLLLHGEGPGDAKAATKCFLRALSLGRSTIEVSKVTSLVSLGHLLAGHGRESLRTAQQAVQLFPAVAENWIVLLAAVLARAFPGATSREVLWLKKTVKHVRTSLQVSQSLADWLANCDEKVNMLVDKILG